MKALIIGCGYVGKAVAATWQSLGYHIKATTRDLDRVPELQQVVDEVVVLSPDYQRSLEQALSDVQVVLVSVAPDTRDGYKEAYLKTAQSLAKLLPDSVHQVIYTGSCSVYGEHGGNWIDEETTPFPLNENTQLLLDAENTLLAQGTDTRRICILRLGEIIGPHREVSDKLRRMNGRTFPGLGTHYTNFSHLTDIVAAINLAATRGLDGVFNLCADIHPMRRDLYTNVCKREGITPVTWDPDKPSIHRGNKKVSSKKIKTLNFEFTGNYPLL